MQTQETNQETNNEAIIIEDLAAPDADEIKGGPTPKSKRFVDLQSSVAGGTGDDDTSVGLSSNHNETVAADETQGASLADLAAQNADEIKGGPKRIFIGGLSVNEAPTALLDLEPQGHIVGGLKGSPQTCVNNTKSIGCSN